VGRPGAFRERAVSLAKKKLRERRKGAWDGQLYVHVLYYPISKQFQAKCTVPREYFTAKRQTPLENPPPAEKATWAGKQAFAQGKAS